MVRYITVLLFLTFSLLLFAEKKPPYEYYHLGNQADITSTTQSDIVLMGAGIDVDAAFQWMCKLSGNGDFLVIRADRKPLYSAAMLK